ncbi:MAG: hypothetical protein J6K45_00620 [Clostridia bacterium]|nr:hypothetical protein [Clostridia bacterium]
MADIKTKDSKPKTIKTLNKAVVGTQNIKDNIVSTKEKINENIPNKDNNENSIEYGSNTITGASSITASAVATKFNKYGKKSFVETKENIMKSKVKIKDFKEKRLAKRMEKQAVKTGKGTIKTGKNTIKNGKTAVKTSKEVAIKTQRMAKESVKASKRAAQAAKETAKATARGIKLAIKATISAIKGIIAGTKALIAALIAGGWVAVVVIIIICLVALLCSSIFGIFFSGEKTSSNSITMNDVVRECNQEFADKLQDIQDKNPHDDYVLDGSMASWKDILLIYTIKQSNGMNEHEVMTIDDNKKKIVKQIFWDMNSVSSEVKTEKVTEQGINTQELPKEVDKKVLHIKITSKNAEQMKNEYHFNPAQIKQYDELSSEKYASLWSGAIYGSLDSGEYVNWRQSGQSWSSIKIGNTNSTLGQIGCLVTSISILIEKSGCNTTIKPFNPGTFLEALNKNNAFDGNGNLQYAGVTKAVPNFKYVGNVNLRGKSRSEKLALITQYFNQGYYLTIEVKGATPGNQHWVAITGINANNVNIVDPARDGTDLWSSYEWSKSSQFNYFTAN